MTATPSAPPTWRVVSFTAEPTPAFSRGSEPMIESVAGVIVSPMPPDMSSIRHNRSTYDVSTRTRENSASPIATTSSPTATVTFVPTLSATRALSGATTMIATANGSNATPVFSAL